MPPKKSSEGFTFTPSIAPLGSTGANGTNNGQKRHDPRSWNNGAADSVRGGPPGTLKPRTQTTVNSTTNHPRKTTSGSIQVPKLFNALPTISGQAGPLPKYANTSAVSSNPAKDSGRVSTEKSTKISPAGHFRVESSKRVSEIPATKLDSPGQSTQEQLAYARKEDSSRYGQQVPGGISIGPVQTRQSKHLFRTGRDGLSAPINSSTGLGTAAESSKRGQWGRPQAPEPSTKPATIHKAHETVKTDSRPENVNPMLSKDRNGRRKQNHFAKKKKKAFEPFDRLKRNAKDDPLLDTSRPLSERIAEMRANKGPMTPDRLYSLAKYRPTFGPEWYAGHNEQNRLNRVESMRQIMDDDEARYGNLSERFHGFRKEEVLRLAGQPSPYEVGIARARSKGYVVNGFGYEGTDWSIINNPRTGAETYIRNPDGSLFMEDGHPWKTGTSDPNL